MNKKYKERNKSNRNYVIEFILTEIFHLKVMEFTNERDMTRLVAAAVFEPATSRKLLSCLYRVIFM